MALSIKTSKLPLTGNTLQVVDGVIETEQDIDMVLAALGQHRTEFGTVGILAKPLASAETDYDFMPPSFGFRLEQLKGVYVHWGAVVSS